ALALNDVTGDEPMLGQILTLLDQPAEAKKLLATAVAMAKEKNQPFNYNAAYILAKTADMLKDYKAGEVFYRIGIEDANKLKSAQRLAQTYGGLIELLFAAQKYDETVKTCQEFLERASTDLGIQLKLAVRKRMIQAVAKQGKTDEALKL